MILKKKKKKKKKMFQVTSKTNDKGNSFKRCSLTMCTWCKNIHKSRFSSSSSSHTCTRAMLLRKQRRINNKAEKAKFHRKQSFYYLFLSHQLLQIIMINGKEIEIDLPSSQFSTFHHFFPFKLILPSARCE